MVDLNSTKDRNRSPSPDGQAATPDETDVDRLGRSRPEAFSNTIMEVGFVTSVLVSNLLSVSIFRFSVANRGGAFPLSFVPAGF